MVSGKNFFIAFVFFVQITAAHQTRPPSKQTSPMSQQGISELYRKINKEFEASIQPILDAKCGDCHSSRTQFPWYHSVPGIRQLLNKDVQEGKKHMDWTGGFPFKGHGKPEEDLRELSRILQDESMPPYLYRLMHPRSPLTKEEKQVIQNWVEKSLQRLSSRTTK